MLELALPILQAIIFVLVIVIVCVELNDEEEE